MVKIDHRALFKLFLLALLIYIVLWLLELQFNIIPSLAGSLFLVFGFPVILALLIAAALVSALIERSVGQNVSMLRCGMYAVILIAIVTWVSYLVFLLIYGFAD